MSTVVWEFRVRAGAESVFIQGYGPEGAWGQLFRRAEGFYRTELLRSVSDSALFYTLDFWASEERYKEFRMRFGSEYELLDEKFAGLTETERLIGMMSSSGE